MSFLLALIILQNLSGPSPFPRKSLGLYCDFCLIIKNILFGPIIQSQHITPTINLSFVVWILSCISKNVFSISCIIVFSLASLVLCIANIVLFICQICFLYFCTQYTASQQNRVITDTSQDSFIFLNCGNKMVYIY